MNIQKNTAQTVSNSGLRDNHRHGKVSAFFEEETKPNSHIAIVTAYFTVAAYMRMKPVLARGEKIRLLFGDPAFIAGFEAVAQNAVFSIHRQRTGQNPAHRQLRCPARRMGSRF